ncbi:MAG TPA: class I SAM-dependent rRNA methyltransferase [Candidatus Saccharimonadia bacterium]|nr:class I SAM-dependent rRNA methyltransferase [Candidatus Saccharimonadia bacterium]
MELPALALKKGEDARLRAGHAWIFSNEVDTRKTPLTGFAPGQHAVVVDHADKPIGLAYVNPNALICARVVVRGLKHPIDRSLIVHRLKVALGLREQLYGRPWYRLVYGESDGLPGLVLDRYGDVVVGQIGTAGMEALKDEVVAAVEKVLKPRAFVWKNAGSVRSLEALPEYVETAFGELPERVIAEEGGLEFEIDVLHGQKTGWFYDQRANRDAMAPYVRDGRVLDLFSYVGAWGVRAASFGASEVLCVDSSKPAIEAIRANAIANRVGARVTAIEEDAFDALKRLRQAKERFDTVIVDPPAFVKRKKDFAEGRLAYRRINEAAMQLLGKDGILITCSCSWHMSRDALLEAVNAGARHLDRHVQVLSRLQQAPDHPVNPAIPETDYLKGFICRVLI